MPLLFRDIRCRRCKVASSAQNRIKLVQACWARGLHDWVSACTTWNRCSLTVTTMPYSVFVSHGQTFNAILNRHASDGTEFDIAVSTVNDSLQGCYSLLIPIPLISHCSIDTHWTRLAKSHLEPTLVCIHYVASEFFFYSVLFLQDGPTSSLVTFLELY